MTRSNETAHESAQERLLHQAGFTIASRTALPGARVYEVTSPTSAGVRVAVRYSDDQGLTLGGRIELSSSELAGTRADSEPALLLLGALAAGLQSQELEAHLLAGKDGLEGIMLSAHVCQDKVDAEQLKALLVRLSQVAKAVTEAVAQPGPARVAAVLRAARLGQASAASVSRVQVSVAPTFDLAARDRLLRNASQEG